ncbi:MAG TPA: prenyltransferase/squalene oxidase repeat-containing protein [Candidatus Angelobacter sp.]|jgi:hypothetical protein|nr:prenyltransferase/squalene oxidase repeat-containing protein [Candidatus Angelobacter sp.]
MVNQQLAIRHREEVRTTTMGEASHPIVFPQAVEPQHRSNADTIAAGMSFLLATRQDGHWTDFNLPIGGSDAWVTAYVLARLAAISPDCMSYSVRQRLEESLDWLMESRTTGGAWGYNSQVEDDADSTAWAILALRGYGRPVPAPALEFIERCRKTDGGIAPYPEESCFSKPWKLSAPEATAVAIGALGVLDARAARFLTEKWLESERPRSRPAPASRLSSRFYACAAVLDWDAGMAPWPVLNKLCELMSYYNTENAFEQSLLLRCLGQLRVQKAWSSAASLRRMQQPDGGWPASALLRPPSTRETEGAGPLYLDHKRVFTTVTAISALSIGESQPGLYFGSDRPQPRRLYEF